jgi:hypothetical protein
MRHVSLALLISLLGLAGAVAPPPARACGGLFCSATQQVNQAAERILFVENGDGTVTAIIEIMYEGPSEKFSWVLPVPGEPKVGISSTTALDRLQQQTNPQYQLQTSFPECDATRFGNRAAGGTSTGADSADGEKGGVNVLAQGTVGPFDYQLIAVDPELPEPADAAVMWLEQEGYDVTALGPEVLGPYLANGLNLIAFRLSKTSMTGSIRPVSITYESENPFIPIRPTAVAANDDMGVMVWVAAAKRAIPANYKALELNETLIDWFNPMATYNDVVSKAADEASGQGFVTELAGPTSALDNVIVQDFERQQWQRASLQTDLVGLLTNFFPAFSGWDGVNDAIAATVQLPEGVSVEDFLGCTQCYIDKPGFSADLDALRKELFEKVYKPMLDTEELLQSRPYVTRLYTTMSADEMTLDPAFDFNDDLGDVSNVHIAERTFDCNDGWKIELPQGDIVYGESGASWPTADMDGQPAARRIMQLSTSGMGKVVKDNAERVTQLLKQTDSGNGARFNRSADDDCGVARPGGGTRAGGVAALGLLAAAWLALRRRRA